jgi:hypothetical protein
MKWLPTLLVALLTAVPISAKPKVDVRVKVNEGVGRDGVTDQLSKNNTTTTDDGTAFKQTVWFLNVTVTAEDPKVVANGNGQWCVKNDNGDDGLFVSGEYAATLDGNSLDILVPLKSGKTEKEHFTIIDHKWRKLSDF